MVGWLERMNIMMIDDDGNKSTKKKIFLVHVRIFPPGCTRLYLYVEAPKSYSQYDIVVIVVHKISHFR